MSFTLNAHMSSRRTFWKEGTENAKCLKQKQLGAAKRQNACEQDQGRMVEMIESDGITSRCSL